MMRRGEACRNAPYWLVPHGWDIAERFTHAALTAHGVTIDAVGFGYARGRKRKVDCNAVYKLLDEGLWWSLLSGKRLAIVSGHAEAFAARLTNAEYARAAGGSDVTWSVATTITCPPVNQPKRTRWPRLRDELFSADWDLLLCSAGSLSGIRCERGKALRRSALDLGSLDAAVLDGLSAS